MLNFCEKTQKMIFFEIAPELTGHGLPLSKCEAYNRGLLDEPTGKFLRPQSDIVHLELLA
jgi:hypothetical protein